MVEDMLKYLGCGQSSGRIATGDSGQSLEIASVPAGEAEQTGGSSLPDPALLAVVICDTAIRDALTNKVSLIGLFSTIRAGSFPCRHPLMTIYVALTGGHGTQPMELRLVRAEDEQRVLSMSGTVDFVDPLQVYELIFEWRGVQFEKPGDYLIEVCCSQDSVPIGTRKFSVVQLGQAPPTAGSEGG